MDKIQVNVDELRTGMYVAELDIPWLDSPFMFQGFLLETDEDLQTLRDVCKYVFVDPEKGDIPPRDNLHSLNTPAQQQSAEITKKTYSNVIEWKGRTRRDVKVSFHKEIERARGFHINTRKQIDTMFNDVRMGRNINISDAKAVVSDMVDSIVANPDAMQWLTNLRNRDEYTAIHSMNVCIFALTFGRYLGFNEDELNELGIGALLHDIGKMCVPLEILNKEGKLTEEEIDIMRSHAEKGHEKLLQSKDELPESALLVAWSHHERKNGNGYPRQLSGESIHLFARIVSIVDVYDAITSDRVYHHGMNTMDALKHVFESRLEQFDTELVEEFIKCIGIYPIGSIVELNSQEVGIVISVAQGRRLTPIVMLVRDATGNPIIPPRTIDLDKFKKGSVERPLEIRRVLEPGASSIDLREYVKVEVPL